MRAKRNDFWDNWEEVSDDRPGLYVSRISARQGEQNAVTDNDMDSFWKRYRDLEAS